MNKFEHNLFTQYYKVMSREYYERIGKAAILAAPHKYAWNAVLYYLQYSQSELLEVKEYIDIKDIVLYQACVTREYLRQNFEKEICESLDVDWIMIEKYVPK